MHRAPIVADPTVIQCSQQCTVTVVHELSFPPFTTLTLEEGGLIAMAIVAVWAVGFLFREIARAFFPGGAFSKDD